MFSLFESIVEYKYVFVFFFEFFLFLSFWIAFIFMVAVVAGEIFYQVSKAPDRNFGFAVAAADGMSYVGLVLGTILVLNIYADDFKSTAYINVVGRGINRKKFIIAKFLDALIIIGGMYLCGGALIFGLQAGLGISLTSLEIRFLFLTFVNELIFTAASISIAAMSKLGRMVSWWAEAIVR